MKKVFLIIVVMIIISMTILIIILKKSEENNFEINRENIIEFDGELIKIENEGDCIKLKEILEDGKYNLEICKGEITHKIVYNSEIYYIKKGCMEIQKGNKQAQMSEEDFKCLVEIIENSRNSLN